MKPQDFFIGIRDFFAIWIPGAVFLSLLSSPTFGAVKLEAGGSNILAFAIAAYVLGSVVSVIGALLDYPADLIMRSGWFRDSIGAQLHEREILAAELRQQIIAGSSYPFSEPLPMSTRMFWWDHLRLECPIAIAELDRIEAAQKLFRSLTPTFGGLLFSVLLHILKPDDVVINGTSLAIGMLVSFMLYFGGRWAFRAAVFRLAIAYFVKEFRGSDSVGPLAPSPRPPR